MIDENVDFGAIHVHKEALADIALSALQEVEGVSLISQGLGERCLEFFGKKRYSGINIAIDKDHQITMNVKIVVRYGLNIPLVARQAQEVVRSAIEKTADVNIKDININVCGIERGSA